MKNFILILILLITIQLYSIDDNTNDSKQKKEINIDFRLMADFNINPFIYETTYKGYGLSIIGALEPGIKIKKFSATFEINEKYFSLTGLEYSNFFEGSWNILRFTVNGYYEPFQFFELKWGAGGAYYSSAFEYNHNGIIGNKYGGLSLLLDGLFRFPYKYVQLRLQNRVDMFFTGDSVIPYYSTDLKCEFHPYFEWINLYISAGIMPWFYNNSDVSINTAMFTWGTGLSIDLSFPKLANKYKKVPEKAEVIKTKTVEEKKEEPEITEEKIIDEKENEEQIKELEKAEEGDVISFSNIIFYPDSDNIKEESLQILDQIAKVLFERGNINIEIIGYTNDVGRPQRELELSKKRSEKVKEHLIKRGISGERIKTYGKGSDNTNKKIISEANRKVEIKILEIEKNK